MRPSPLGGHEHETFDLTPSSQKAIRSNMWFHPNFFMYLYPAVRMYAAVASIFSALCIDSYTTSGAGSIPGSTQASILRPAPFALHPSPFINFFRPLTRFTLHPPPFTFPDQEIKPGLTKVTTVTAATTKR